MSFFPCPYLNAAVELTEEREQHIARHHPDLLPKYRDQLAETLADPDQVRSSQRMEDARLFSRWYDIDCWWEICRCRRRCRRGCQTHLGGHRLYCKENGGRRNGMEEKLTFEYDRDTDILYINKRQPYPEQESEELGDDVIARLNPETAEIENIEVLFFSKRLKHRQSFVVPIKADLRLSGEARL